MNNTSSSSSSDIGFFGLLGVAFIVLKLTGFINWSWWWVTAPLWGPVVFVVLVLIVWLVIYLIQRNIKVKTNKGK